jgi:plastocyanin
MLGDESGYRYEPAHVTIRPGDVVRWVMVSGGPHDVAFSEATLPETGRAALRANMPDQRQPFGSPFFMNAGEAYTVSFAGVAPGRYAYYCTPHLMMGMVGSVTVQSE